MRELTKNLLQDHGAVVSCENKKVKMTLPAKSLMQFLCDKKLRKDLKAHNQDLIEGFCDDDKDGWRGGSLSDLKKAFEQGVDLKNHLKAQKKIEQGDLGQKIKALNDGLITRRRLTTSDVDGDFIYSRRFDDKPFVLSKKTRVPQKVIEVNVSLSVNGSASAESIDNFAAFAWAIINLIESKGIQCKVLTSIQSKGPDQEGDLDVTCEAIIKNAGEYLAPSKLAACLSTLFMRHALFTGLVLGCDLMNKNSYSGLGRAVQAPTVDFSKGRLTLNPDCISANTEKVINELTKIFKVQT